MNKELIIRSNSSAVDFALLKDGKLIELNKEVDNNKFSVGDIYAAKIRKPVSGLNAAFVGVGHEKHEPDDQSEQLYNVSQLVFQRGYQPLCYLEHTLIHFSPA